MIHFILSIVLLIVGIYLAIVFATVALKIIGFVLIVAGIVWLLGAFRRNRAGAGRTV